jgi:2'-5' RNA ligase
MRIFIAFQLPSTIKELVQNIQSEIKKFDKKIPIQWSKTEMLHITLEFLGELEAEKIIQVKEQLITIISHYYSFKFQNTTINAFPNITNPHILFLSIEEHSGQGTMLHQELHQKLLELGIKSEHHDWRPHITIGRIKREWHNYYDLSAFTIQKEVWNNESVHLMEGIKKESEYTYIPLFEFFFKK